VRIWTITSILLGSLVGATPEPTQHDNNACGPIATFVALLSIGVDAELTDVASRCKWTEGDFVQGDQIVAALHTFPNTHVRAVRVTLTDVESHLRSGAAAILFVRRGSTVPNHAICLVGVVGDGFSYVELPGGEQVIARNEIESIWSGEAILVRRSCLGQLVCDWPWSAPIFSTRGYESRVWVKDSAVGCWSEGVARSEAADCDANSDGVW